MSDRVPLLQEDVDVITRHLKSMGKLESAHYVQGMYDEIVKLYKQLGESAIEVDR